MGDVYRIVDNWNKNRKNQLVHRMAKSFKYLRLIFLEVQRHDNW